MSVTLHTDLGNIKLELDVNQAPKTCENVMALAASNYYDGCKIHRNIKDFLMQTGDPTGTGKGGASIWGGKFGDEISPHLRHSQRGIVSMANGGPNTNGSQFFITYKRHPSLDGKYTIFGRVIDGFETLDYIEKVPVGPGHKPLSEVKIRDITIHANPIADM